MKISAGISEISLNYYQNNRVKSEKAFVWPLYNAGRVEKIRGVTRRTETNIIYSKPSLEDREKIITLSKENPRSEYNSNGCIHSKISLVQPGSLFDAIV